METIKKSIYKKIYKGYIYKKFRIERLIEITYIIVIKKYSKEEIG